MVPRWYPEDLDDFLEPSTAEDVLVRFVDLVALVMHGWVDEFVVIELLHVGIASCILEVLVLVGQGQLVGPLLINVVLNRLVSAVRAIRYIVSLPLIAYSMLGSFLLDSAFDHAQCAVLDKELHEKLNLSKALGLSLFVQHV